MIFTSIFFVYQARKKSRTVDEIEKDIDEERKEREIKKQLDEFFSYTGYVPPSRGELDG
jgi:hypothetical protein